MAFLMYLGIILSLPIIGLFAILRAYAMERELYLFLSSWARIIHVYNFVTLEMLPGYRNLKYWCVKLVPSYQS